MGLTDIVNVAMSYEYCMGFLNTKAIELWFHFIEYCRKIDSN